MTRVVEWAMTKEQFEKHVASIPTHLHDGRPLSAHERGLMLMTTGKRIPGLKYDPQPGDPD